MRGGIIFLLLLITSGFANASALGSFSNPSLSSAAPTSQLKSQSPSKFALSIKQQKERTLEIKDAVIWHTPNKIFLGKKLTEDEIQNLDSAALEILIAGLSVNNANFAASSKKVSSKNFILKLGDIAKASGNEPISNLGAFMVNSRQEADSYVRKTLAQVYKEYGIFKEIYQAKQIRDLKADDYSLNARKNLIYLCGNQAVEEVENLWRRDE